ncbi:MAG: dipeptide epimerase, partial [Beijerinckiaceae bacterium]|nr:dipeptide epimerase [Beijerinckiaceae bacterium]
MATLRAEIESFPIAGRFVISRGAKTEARVVVATTEAGAFRGRGECVPYPRYGESVESVVAAIEGVRAQIEAGADRAQLQALLPPGAARNALDCALWDLEAKTTGVPAHVRAGIAAPGPVVTAYTISVDTPEAMAAAAARASSRPLLKVKLGGAGDRERIAA